jgi:hypothetical protein
MKLTKSMMKQILKEEYEKRIKYFLKEEMPIKDSRGVNVLKDAEDLKVREKKSGGEYTFDSIVNVEGEEFAKCWLPEEPRTATLGGSAETSLNENDYDEYGFISSVREIEPVNDDFDQMKLLGYEEEEEDDSGEEEQKIKLPSRKYILVPMGEFQERFEF